MKPLSWSELSLWERDPLEWSRRYLLGLKPDPSPSMRRGTDIHQAIAGTSQRYLNRSAYLPREVRINTTVVQQIQKIMRHSLSPAYEHRSEATIDEIPTIGFWDAYQNSTMDLWEFKTTKGQPQHYMEDYRAQLSFYTLQHLTVYQAPPRTIKLVVGSTTHGRVYVFTILLSPDELADVRRRIRYMWAALGEERRMLRLEPTYDH